MNTPLSTKKQETRRRILEAAAKIFAQDGLMQASMRKIAQEAGCTTGAIYPLFDGKEALYVPLLEESLDRLYTAVSTASQQEKNNLEALIASVRAFYQYYISNVFEANLGIYIYGMGQIKGMGREQDHLLNQKLLNSLNIYTSHLEALAPRELSDAQQKAWATAERDQIFTMLIGLLTMHQSGRAKSIGTTTDDIFTNHISRLRKQYHTTN